MSTTRFALFAVVFTFAVSAARADVTLIGIAGNPGDASDLSGLAGKTSDCIPHNRLGGHGSGIAFTGRGEEYLLISDRGPKDGASDFICRYHRMIICVKPSEEQPVSMKLLATTLLKNENRKHFVGALDAFTQAKPEKNLRLDPEGIRVGRDGMVFVSDEYGPVVYAFDTKGKRTHVLPVPDHFRLRKPGKTSADELPPHNASGRVPNRGMEGLAISPDGSKLYGIMQGPIIQDGAINEKGERIGVNCRILEIDTASGKTREFVYRLDDSSLSVCEILAVNDCEFLVLERDGKGGKEAKVKKLFHIDLTGATDVSKVKSLPSGALPASITPVKKKPFIDLLAKKFGIAGENCPEKLEGIAFGPNLFDGRLLLLLTADNDFIADRPFRIYAFAIDKADLPNFQSQQFDIKK